MGRPSRLLDKEEVWNTLFVVILERVNKMPWVKGINSILALLSLIYQRKILLSTCKVRTMTKRVALTVEEYYSQYALKVIKDFPGIISKEFVQFSEKNNTIVIASY